MKRQTETGKMKAAAHRFAATKSLCMVWAAVCLLCALVTGCRLPTAAAVNLHAPYRPDNVFLAAPSLPGDVKRVAVLPVVCDARRTDLAAGRGDLQPVLLAELIKAKRFEVVQVPTKALWRLTGRADWAGDEILPPGLLGSLEKKYGCDAVLFCQLTEFRAYPPLAIGWRLKLVDVRGKKVIWAGDEQFDAGRPAVMAAALRYQEHEQRQLGDDTTDWLTVNSPRWFGQYSLASLFNTLPAR